MNRLPFKGTCVKLSVGFLNAIDGSARKITRQTFLRNVDQREMSSLEDSLGYGDHLRMSKDWNVSYWSSKYNGQPVYFFDWSRIHHVFMGVENESS